MNDPRLTEFKVVFDKDFGVKHVIDGTITAVCDIGRGEGLDGPKRFVVTQRFKGTARPFGIVLFTTVFDGHFSWGALFKFLEEPVTDGPPMWREEPSPNA
jgi:hypothetical protein